MLISNEYRAQQAQLHKEKDGFGTSADMYADIVQSLINKYKPKNFLDYGAGKQVMRPYVTVPYIPYDPAIEAISKQPPPCDMVMTADVLEHLEMDYLDAVMDDLVRVTKRVGFHVVHTGAAINHLPDGRNAHLIQKPPEWWLPHFINRFNIIRFERMPNGFFILVERR